MSESGVTSYSTATWSRQRSLVGTVAALLFTVSLFGALAWLHGERTRFNSLHDSAVELAAVANGLSALEWETMANGDAEEDEFREADALVEAGDALVTEVVDLGPRGTAALVSAWATYSDGALQMIVLVDAGDFESADELDDAVVDPAFERLSESITAIRAQARGLDARATRAQVIGSVGLIAAALVALAVATSLAHRRRRATAVAAVLEEAQEQLRYQATHDSLTGLPNRTLFHDAISNEAQNHRAGDDGFAVLVVDLDGFKDVNDTLGHHTGDELLHAVAARLRARIRSTDVIARLGGDEFALLVRGVKDEAYPARLAQRLLDALRTPVQAGALAVVVEGSIGIALCPRHGTDPEELLRCADTAMYRAKSQRNTFAFYDAEDDTVDSNQLTLLSDLREALARDTGELFLAYQPQVDPATGGVDSVEALLRWNHPTFGPVAPDRFIPGAERTSLIDVLTTFVLDRALAQLVAWDQEGLHLSVAVNISVRNLMDERLPDDIAGLLQRHGVEPARLEVEITETAIMNDRDRAARVLKRLAQLGVRIALDDYGTGYSSLAFIQELPLNVLKIDRRFIAGMSGSPRDRAIVASTIDLARHLGLRVVAEGVETDDDVSHTTWRRCDLVQGYLFSKPVEATALRASIEACGRSSAIVTV